MLQKAGRGGSLRSGFVDGDFFRRFDLSRLGFRRLGFRRLGRFFSGLSRHGLVYVVGSAAASTCCRANQKGAANGESENLRS